MRLPSSAVTPPFWPSACSLIPGSLFHEIFMETITPGQRIQNERCCFDVLSYLPSLKIARQKIAIKKKSILRKDAHLIGTNTEICMIDPRSFFLYVAIKQCSPIKAPKALTWAECSAWNSGNTTISLLLWISALSSCCVCASGWCVPTPFSLEQGFPSCRAQAHRQTWTLHRHDTKFHWIDENNFGHNQMW